jgi:predicted transposase/invertase (TIGR01784 family)
MKTDSIFYRLFQEYPAVFFEILGQSGETAQYYTFTSVEVKQTAFRLDGVFESNLPELPTYFIEVQFQEDRRFFDRTIAEIILYLAQNDRVTDWHFVIWTARPNLLPALPHKYQPLSSNITIVCLNQLWDVPDKPLGMQLIDLILCPVHQAPVKVSQLLVKLHHLTEPNLQQLMIDLMETVLIYKFDKLSRQEIETMFGLSELKQTRVYQEAREEGLQIGRQEGKQEGRQEGMRLGEVRLLIRQLSLRFGKLSQSQQERIANLSLEELERLGEDLLTWQSPDDLPAWLRE